MASSAAQRCRQRPWPGAALPVRATWQCMQVSFFLEMHAVAQTGNKLNCNYQVWLLEIEAADRGSCRRLTCVSADGT